MSSNSTVTDAQMQLKLGINVAKPTASAGKDQIRHKKVRFRPYQIKQLGLFSMRFEDLLPKNHLVFWVLDAVDWLDLSKIMVKYEGKSGFGPGGYDPKMMVALWIYCYCKAVHSSRGIEEMTTENIACRIITGNEVPDHDTINEFRQMHLEELGALFQQALGLAVLAGLVDLKTVAVDGSKVKAFASKRKSMSYERMCKKLVETPKLIRELKNKLSKLEGKGDMMTQRTRQQLQKEITFQEKRLTRIKNRKKALEKRVRDAGGARPEPTAQINFTDAESNIMHKSGKTFEQGYNAQITVDSKAQIIVAQDVVRDNNDQKQLVPMLNMTKQNMGKMPDAALADAGYCSEANLTSKELEMVDLFIPPKKNEQSSGAIKTVGRIPEDISVMDRMRRKLNTAQGRVIYKQRKAIVEPVFGQIKNSVLEFASFSFRGLDKVKAEWAFVSAIHNLLKVFRSGYRFELTMA